MLVYLLKANIALTLFYLAYRFGLRRLTFYTLNRFFLLAGIVCSATFPFIDPAALFQQQVPLHETVGTYVPDLAALNARPSTPLINIILIYIFWTGVLVMGLRFLIQLFSLWKLHHQTTIAAVNDQEVRVTAKKLSPFSFLSNIYINPALHSPSELSAIIQHEQIHVKQLHSLDIILGELNRIFYWFNPGAWLMSIAIRENLEFITDRCVLQQGMDAKTYQYSLVQVSGIPNATAIANHFNFSHLKQRIMMMNKKKSSRYQLVRYLLLGCLVGVALLSLNISRAGNKVSKSITQMKIVQASADTVTPPPPPPPPAKPAKIVHAAPPAPPAQPLPPVAPVAPAGKPLPAPLPAIAPAATPLPPLPPTGPVTFTATTLSGNKPDSYTFKATDDAHQGAATTLQSGQSGITIKGDAHPVFFVDDVYVGYESPAIDGKDVEYVNVLKGEGAVEKYGEKAKDGVVAIYTKGFVAKPAKIIIKADTPTPSFYILDGKKITAEEFKKLDPNKIATMNVLNGEGATAIYGSAAADGAIVIKSK